MFKGPRSADQRQRNIVAVQAREPAFGAIDNVRVVMKSLGDILDAFDFADGVGIGRRERGRRAEPRFGVAEALAGGGMVVLFHRVVFGMPHRDKERPVVFEQVALLFHRACIVVRFRFVIAGGDDDGVHPGRAYLVLDRGLRAAAKRDHGQNRRHADGDSDHGERRLQFVAAQRAEGD